MGNEVIKTSVGMLSKKFYCSCCGERMVRTPKSRLIKEDDPEYYEHAPMENVPMERYGYIKLIEYDLKCLSCDTVHSFEEQRLIAWIQKRLKKKILTEEELLVYAEEGRAALIKKDRRTFIVRNLIIYLFLAAVILACLLKELR